MRAHRPSSTRLAGLAFAASLLAAPPAVAQRNQPPEEPPRSDASSLFVGSDVFADDQWNDMVVEIEAQVNADVAGPAEPRLETSRTATLAPLQRRSIDQDVLQQMIVDRARRLSMRAVADVLADLAGPAADRVYLQELATASGALLVDRTGMQNTLVEQLVAVIVRAVIADAIVRSRFPEATLTSACRWRTAVYGGALPATRGAQQEQACRAEPIEELARSCAQQADAPIPCALRVRDARGRLSAFTPARTSDADAIRLRTYLTDLAYWSLGRTPLFARRTSLPTCAFERGHAYAPLCEAVAAGADDDARQRRIDALLGTPDLLAGLGLAREMLGLLQPPGYLRLGALVDAYVRRPELGDLDRTPALAEGRAAWRYTELMAWGETWQALLPLAEAVAAFLPDRAPGAPESVARIRATLAEASRAVTANCVTGPEASPLRSLCGDERPPAPRPPGAMSPPPLLNLDGTPFQQPDCSAANTSLRSWVRALPGLLSGAANAPISRRLDSLCVPAHFTAVIRDSRNRIDREERLATLEAIVRHATAARLAAESFRAGGAVGALRLSQVDSIATSARALATELRGVADAMGAPAASHLVYYSPARPPDWAFRLKSSARITLGFSRLMTLLGALDQHALRARGIESVGQVMSAMRGLGSRTSLVLERLGPVLQYVRPGHPVSVEVMLLMLDQMPVEDIVVALGVAERKENWCEREEAGLPCWTQRILMVIREATDVSGEQVSVDPNRLVTTLGAMGDDFRRRTAWRWYFHLTIGLGEMLSVRPPDITGEGREKTRFVPLMSEQIGLGYASPSFWGDRFAVRFGIFGSGILYRVVLDSEESNAFMFGGFFAVDAYELLEFFVAPMVLVYPPGDDRSVPPSFALAAGASVPLGDYLSAL